MPGNAAPLLKVGASLDGAALAGAGVLPSDGGGERIGGGGMPPAGDPGAPPSAGGGGKLNPPGIPGKPGIPLLGMLIWIVDVSTTGATAL